MKLLHLPDGAYFEMVGMEKTYRNLRLVRAHEGGALIRGEILRDGNFIPLGKSYYISSDTQVNRLKKEQVMEKEQENEKNEVVKSATVRKEKVARVFPTGEFTVAKLVELWQCSQPTANNEVNDAIEKGRVVLVRNEKRGGKGRPTRILSLVGNGASVESPVTVVPATVPTETLVTPVVESSINAKEVD